MSSSGPMQNAHPSEMAIHRAGTGTMDGPKGISNALFRVRTLLSSQTDGEMTAMRTFFRQGGVTHWHSHQLGQLLFVVDGTGLVQREGGEIIEVHAGDSVWFAPGERHWHGAPRLSLPSAMSAYSR